MRLGKMIAWASAALMIAFYSAPSQAQDLRTQYPHRLAIEQYLMGRNDEIALAKSAAPESISRDATVLVLGRHGYETSIQGNNGFICMVERGWVGSFDWPEMWNPKIRGADCLNPPAARSILPWAEIRTEMVLDGRSMPEIIARIRVALSKREVPALEPGAMSYMMSKGSYLTDQDDHNGPHLMFYEPVTNGGSWGAGMPGSPVGSASYWFVSEKPKQELNGFPPIRIFTVELGKWSDGTLVSSH